MKQSRVYKAYGRVQGAVRALASHCEDPLPEDTAKCLDIVVDLENDLGDLQRLIVAFENDIYEDETP